MMMHSRLTLERELHELLGTGRNALIAARYYGFDGRGGGSLQAVGNEIGVTAERVRQIVTAASESLNTRRAVSPTLDRTIAFVAEHMPAAAGEIEAALQFQRLTSSLFRLEGVIKAAELLGKRLPFSITELREERLVHARDIPSVDMIVRIARRVISRWGMATLSDVVAEVRKVESGVCDRNLVASALACVGGLHWLEHSAGWFWLPDNRNNPLLNRIRKILSVANPIEISKLRAGIGRDYSMKGFSPPKRVLLEFCRQAPGLRVEDETVKAEPVINSDGVLAQAGGIMNRSKLTLERELHELLGTGRNARLAARYYGFDGRGGGTLQSVGNEIGVTRERIRQIVAAASQGLRTGRAVSPMLDRTIAFVVDHMPAAAGEIEAALQFQRLTSGLFRLEGVIKAAELLGRCLPFSISEVKGERLVHVPDIPSVDMIVRIARRVISRWGMATLSGVVAEVRKVESGVCDRKLVEQALACLEGFRWLEQSADDWFWLSDNPNNAVLNRIRKILSVASPINISELWAGIGRDYRMKRFSPPKRVLLEFCRQAPGLRVNHETVKAVPGVNSDDVLSRTERDIVHLLSEHGGTITPSELTSVCLGMGVNQRTFYRDLVSSPIISRYAGGLYGLIGSGKRSGRGARLSFPEHRGRVMESSTMSPELEHHGEEEDLILREPFSTSQSSKGELW
jgi:hypothetical protein